MTRVAVKRPVSTFMVILIFLAFGFMSLTNLRMDLLPNMNIPVAVVFTSYRGASPDQIQKLVTEPIESSMAQLNGLDTLSSISNENYSYVILQFDQDVDIDFAAIDIREAVDLTKRNLPDDANDPIVMKMDINAMSAIYIAVSSDTDDLVTLKTKVDDQIADRLTRQNGVAEVTVSGGREKEIRVDLMEDRIRGYGISESTIASIITAENSSMPVGSITEAGKNLTIKVDGQFTDIEEIKNLPVSTGSGGTVFIRDIADVYEDYKDISSYSYLNGQSAVTMSISKQSTANTVNVSNVVMRELDAIIAEYPELEIKVILDPADYITDSLNSVANTAISGVVLACIVLFVFLRNFRTTLVVGSAIPLSIMVTFAFMYFAGMTLNLMSLGGLTLGVGMLVDNSIVVLESIFRRMEEGESKTRAAINGAREVSMSIVASTLTTVAVFVPVAWMGGMIAQIFNDLALSISFALAASLLVALTFVPLACSLFLTPSDQQKHETYLSRLLMGISAWFGTRLIGAKNRYLKGVKWCTTHKGSIVVRILKFIILIPFHLFAVLLLLWALLSAAFWGVLWLVSKGLTPIEKVFLFLAKKLLDVLNKGIDAIVRGYSAALRWSTRHRKITMLLTFLLFVGSLSTAAGVGMELLPSADQSQIDINITLPDGAELERTRAITEQALERIEGTPDIKDVSTSISSNSASITIALPPMKERSRSSTEIADDLRRKTRDVAGAEITVEALTSMMGGGSFSGGGDFSYSIKGDDIDTLVQTADELVALISTVSGVRDVSSTVSDTIPQATIKVDRMRASSFGLSATTVMGIVNTTISGSTPTTFKIDGDEFDIRVGQNDSKIQNLEDLENLLIPTPMGISVPLREVATITLTDSPQSIQRENQMTYVSVYGSLDGRDLGSATREINNLIASGYIFPQGVELETSGSSQTMNEEIASMVQAFLVALFVVYAIMAAEFESLYYPMVIMLAVPTALSTGFLGLFVMGHTFGITAALGMIMLLGIVVNNGIVLIDYINLLRGKGKNLMEAVQEAGPVRLRAILMTTLTTALGLLPMMLGAQEGSEMMQPLATVVVWGLSLCTLITLFFIPAIYISFDMIRDKLFGQRKKFRKVEEL